jgi:hypothetical protein
MRFTIREIKPTSPWTPGGVVSFDFQSILNEFRSWSYPCIHDMYFRWAPTFSTGAGGGVPRILPQGFASNILIQDVGGQRVNLRGSSLHNLLKYEYGQAYNNIAADAANDAGPTVQEMYFPVPIKPPKARRRRDYSIAVDSFLDGGSVQLTCGPATPVATYYTFASAELSLIVRIVEEGQPELKSRFLVRDQTIPSTDFAGYVIGGFIRDALWYVGESSEATAAPWAPQKLDSYTLNYQQVRDTALREMHLLQSETFRPDSGTPATPSAIVNEDPVFTGQVVPVIWPQGDQKITDMIQASTLHVRTTLPSVPADAKLITTVLEERNPLASQRVFKRTDVAGAIRSSGRVKTANGQKKGVGEFPVDLVNVMPVKIDAGK